MGDLPPKLAKLAEHASIGLHQEPATPGTPTRSTRHGQRDKGGIPPRTGNEPVEEALKYKQFVLSGSWPDFGGGIPGPGQGLTQGRGRSLWGKRDKIVLLAAQCFGG